MNFKAKFDHKMNLFVGAMGTAYHGTYMCDSGGNGAIHGLRLVTWLHDMWHHILDFWHRIHCSVCRSLADHAMPIEGWGCGDLVPLNAAIHN
jgi:hypothetical protein